MTYPLPPTSTSSPVLSLYETKKNTSSMNFLHGLRWTIQNYQHLTIFGGYFTWLHFIRILSNSFYFTFFRAFFLNYQKQKCRMNILCMCKCMSLYFKMFNPPTIYFKYLIWMKNSVINSMYFLCTCLMTFSANILKLNCWMPIILNHWQTSLTSILRVFDLYI